MVKKPPIIRNIRRSGNNTVIIHGNDFAPEIKEVLHEEDGPRKGKVKTKYRAEKPSTIIAELFDAPTYSLNDDRCALSVKPCADMKEARAWAALQLTEKS